MSGERKSLVLYFLLIPGVVFLYFVFSGSLLSGTDVVTPNSAGDINSFLHFGSDTVFMLIQMIIIIAASRALGYLFSKIGQPSVIGEITAGIVLGPSLLGQVWPEGMSLLFPADSIQMLGTLSQLGLILFMFVIGMELDFHQFKNKARSALLISHGTISLAFLSGLLLSLFLFETFGNPEGGFLSFALFLGISFSVTAFPVLARVVFEKGLHKKNIGILALAAAAFDDVTAWCLLAGIIAFSEAGSALNMFYTLSLVGVFLLIVFLLIQPFFKRLGEIYATPENTNKTVVGLVFVVVFGFSLTTEILGIHALFGAFIAGLIMPSKVGFKQNLIDKIEDISLVMLLPLFFAYTGLRTDFSILFQENILSYALLIIAVAMSVKVGGGMLLAKFSGNSWKDSLILGTLLNTRGLMELIVLNIGYDMKILSSEMFTILVLMALSTTFMTGPILALIEKFWPDKVQDAAPIFDTEPSLRVMLSFGLPKMGSSLLRLTYTLFGSNSKEVHYTAAHFTPDTDLNRNELLKFEKEGFAPIKAYAEIEHIKIDTFYKATHDLNADIIDTFHSGKNDLLLIGGAKSLFSDNYMAGRVRKLVQETNGSVGIFIEKHTEVISRIGILMDNYDSLPLALLPKKIIENRSAEIDLIDLNNSTAVLEDFDHKNVLYDHIKTMGIFTNTTYKEPSKALFEGYDLILTEINFWEQILKTRMSCLQYIPSILVVKLEDQLVKKLLIQENISYTEAFSG